MKDYSDLGVLNDKKLRTLRNNLNNRLESFKKNDPKHLPPSHMLHGLDEKNCLDLLARVQKELSVRSK